MYRTARLLTPDAPVVRRPPWQAPHHTSSLPALTGTTARPGAFGLAHGGVLLCEDAGEWPTRAVQALLSAMANGQVVAVRAGIRTVYPTRFQLVLTARDCPQAAAHRGGRCDCPPAAVARYRQRLTPLLDQVDIRVTLPVPTRAAGTAAGGEASHTVAARVARARAAAADRWTRYGLTLNREVGAGALGTDLARSWVAEVTALQVRPDAAHLSFLQASRVLAVAYTLADLAGRDQPGDPELAEAIALHGTPLSDAPTGGEVR
jgi:magnesium chelatase family protein